MRTTILSAAAAALAPGAVPQTKEPGELFVLRFAPGPNWVAGRPMAAQDLRTHAAYHARLVRDSHSVAKAFVSWESGMALVRAADRLEAAAVAAADPAFLNGVFSVTLEHWRSSFVSELPLRR